MANESSELSDEEEQVDLERIRRETIAYLALPPRQRFKEDILTAFRICMYQNRKKKK